MRHSFEICQFGVIIGASKVGRISISKGAFTVAVSVAVDHVNRIILVICESGVINMDIIRILSMHHLFSYEDSLFCFTVKRLQNAYFKVCCFFLFLYAGS